MVNSDVRRKDGALMSRVKDTDPTSRHSGTKPVGRKGSYH